MATKFSPKFVWPNNGERLSDPVYWFLRTIQSIVQVGEPPSFTPLRPNIDDIELVEPYRGQPIRPASFRLIPARENLCVVQDIDATRFHLLSGPKFSFGQTFVLDDAEISAIDASPSGLYVLTRSGDLLRLGLVPLLGKIKAPATPPMSIRSLDVTRVQRAFPSSSTGAPAGMVCLASESKDGTRLSEGALLFDPALERVIFYESTTTHLVRRELILPLSHQLRTSVNFVSANAMGKRVALFDAKGGRMYLLDPFEAAPRLRLVAGDGDPRRATGYGPLPKDGRLPEASSVCFYTINDSLAADLEVCLRFQFQDSKASKSSADAMPSSTDGVQKLKRHVIQQAGFFVLFSPAAMSVTTCTIPSDDPKLQRLLPGAQPMLLPLTAMHPGAALKMPDPYAPLLERIGGMSEVSQGPQSSLMFWRKGLAKVVLLQSSGDAFEQILRNQAHIDELNKLSGRRPSGNVSRT